MTTITAWVLMTFVSFHSGFQYSPPVATKEACEAFKVEAERRLRDSAGNSSIITCVKVEMHK
jgi:hypothetical protein